MFCIKCGNELTDEVIFCSQCGNKIDISHQKGNNNEDIEINENNSKYSEIQPDLIYETTGKAKWIPLIFFAPIVVLLLIIIPKVFESKEVKDFFKNSKESISNNLTINSSNKYKPLVLTKEDFQKMFNDPVDTLSNSDLMEQIMVFDILERGGDSFLIACAADYNDKKKYISKLSPWGIYYKKIEKDNYDIIVDMEKFIEFYKNFYKDIYK